MAIGAAFGVGGGAGRLAVGARPPVRRFLVRLGLRPGRDLLAVLLLLAFLWQGLLVQVHIHAPERTTASAGTAERVAAKRSADDDPATCPLCRERAQAGRYLPADPPALPRPAAVRPFRSRPPGRRWRVRKRSHAWHSRGPPARAA
jgi:hypothetical protein